MPWGVTGEADAREKVFRVVSAGSRLALCSGMRSTRSSQAKKRVTWSSLAPEVVV